MLKKAELISTGTPTLEEELAKKALSENNPMTEREAKQKERDRRRTIHFCVGYSRAWRIPIHKIIKKNKLRYGLTWLRVAMSYHRFTNLREIFQGDLSHKLTMDV